MCSSFIVIIDHDKTAAEEFAAEISKQGYLVDVAQHGYDALMRYSEKKFDICILDLGLPNEDIFGLIKQFKKCRTPVSVILTAEDIPVEMTIKAIRYHVKDIFLRPFDMPLVLERLDAVIDEHQTEKMKELCLEKIQDLIGRVVENHDGKSNLQKDLVVLEREIKTTSTVRYGDIFVDPETRHVVIDGDRQFHLSITNFKYFQVLMQHAPKAVSFKKLVYEAQGFDLPGQEAKNLAFWHVHKLRKELCNGFNQDLIQNVRGYGYKLNHVN